MMTSVHINNKNTMKSAFSVSFFPESAKLPAVQSAVVENISRNFGENGCFTFVLLARWKLLFF